MFHPIGRTIVLLNVDCDYRAGSKSFLLSKTEIIDRSSKPCVVVSQLSNIVRVSMKHRHILIYLDGDMHFNKIRNSVPFVHVFSVH